MTATTTVEPSKVFIVDYANEYRDEQGETVLPLVPLESPNTSIVFETRTGKLWAYLDKGELVIAPYEGPFGVVVMPDSDSSIRVVAFT